MVFQAGIQCGEVSRAAGPSPWHPCLCEFSKGPSTIYDSPVMGFAKKIGWKRLKEKYLDKKHSICLLADNDVDEKKLKRQCKLSFQKATFVQYVASTCLSQNDSFLVAASQ